VLQTARAGYYGHITQIDHQINRICEELHHLNLWQNTIILFLSDHGEMLGDHHCFQKIKPYEGSAQVPMVLRAPPAMGVPQNAVRHELVELADVMPTLLDLAGVPIPDGLDGRSFAPVARGEAPADWRPIMHGEHTAGGVGGYQWLTDGREKYIWLTGTGHEQLFDLANDPEERYDLARSPDPATQARVAAWRQRLIREIEGFEEGFVQDGELVPGRPQQAVLAHLREAADRYTPPPAPRR